MASKRIATTQPSKVEPVLTDEGRRKEEGGEPTPEELRRRLTELIRDSNAEEERLAKEYGLQFDEELHNLQFEKELDIRIWRVMESDWRVMDSDWRAVELSSERFQTLPVSSKRMLMGSARTTAIQEMQDEQDQLRELARELPGANTSNPINTIWGYLIVKHGFGPEQLRGMSIAEMRLYIEKSRESGLASQEGTERDAKAEARDKWLYQQASQKNWPTWKALMAKLNKVAADHGWTRLRSIQGVKQAVDRYIRRHELPPLPRRKET